METNKDEILRLLEEVIDLKKMQLACELVGSRTLTSFDKVLIQEAREAFDNKHKILVNMISAQ